MTLKTAYLLDTAKYDALLGTKKEDVSHREATASNIDAMPTTPENVPSTKSSSNNIIPQSSGVVNTVGTPLIERLNALSANNEAITVEEVKKASGFGENGAKLLTDIVNNSEGAIFSDVNDAMRNAYLAERAGLDGKQLDFVTNLQIDAFTAGKMDRECKTCLTKRNMIQPTTKNQSILCMIFQRAVKL